MGIGTKHKQKTQTPEKEKQHTPENSPRWNDNS